MLVQRKKTHSEIVGKNIATINATVTMPDGVEELPIGTLLVSDDGGMTFEVLDQEADPAQEPNGVLCDYLRATETASVLIAGFIIERNLPEPITPAQRTALFTRHIILV